MVVDNGLHYLYRYVRLDKSEPFYIGIGTKDRRDKTSVAYTRAKADHPHNNIWKKIKSKAEYEIDILLESDDYKFIKQKEQEFIKLYGRIDLGTGCLANMTDGGEGNRGWSPSKEIRDKMSEQRKGEKNIHYGKHLSEEHRRKIGAAQTGDNNHTYGKKWSQERREKFSASRKGKKRSEEFCVKISKALKGRIMTEEHRRKLSEKAKGRKRINVIGKPVINTVTGKIYPSVEKASVDYQYSSVSLKCKLKGKTVNDTDFIYYKGELPWQN